MYLAEVVEESTELPSCPYRDRKDACEGECSLPFLFNTLVFASLGSHWAVCLILCTFPLLTLSFSFHPPTKLPSSLSPGGNCSPFAHLKLPLNHGVYLVSLQRLPSDPSEVLCPKLLTPAPSNPCPSSLCLFSLQRHLNHYHHSEWNKLSPNLTTSVPCHLPASCLAAPCSPGDRRKIRNQTSI